MFKFVANDRSVCKDEVLQMNSSQRKSLEERYFEETRKQIFVVAKLVAMKKLSF